MKKNPSQLIFVRRLDLIIAIFRANRLGIPSSG